MEPGHCGLLEEHSGRVARDDGVLRRACARWGGTLARLPLHMQGCISKPVRHIAVALSPQHTHQATRVFILL